MNILEEAMNLVTGLRRDHYGTPEDNHGRTARLWSAYLVGRTAVTPRDVCMLNILQKISRDHHCPMRDNLVDIAGYALNAELMDGPRRMTDAEIMERYLRTGPRQTASTETETDGA